MPKNKVTEHAVQVWHEILAVCIAVETKACGRQFRLVLFAVHLNYLVR